MTKKIGVVGSMINTSDYLLFEDLRERYILKGINKQMNTIIKI